MDRIRITLVLEADIESGSSAYLIAGMLNGEPRFAKRVVTEAVNGRQAYRGVKAGKITTEVERIPFVAETARMKI